jgi:hypothetical protein
MDTVPPQALSDYVTLTRASRPLPFRLYGLSRLSLDLIQPYHPLQSLETSIPAWCCTCSHTNCRNMRDIKASPMITASIPVANQPCGPTPYPVTKCSKPSDKLHYRRLGIHGSVDDPFPAQTENYTSLNMLTSHERSIASWAGISF